LNRREFDMSDGIIKKISRVIFWRYRRGGWQYDILCILILLFIFLVPSSVLDGSYFDKTDSSSVAETKGSTASSGQPVPETAAPQENQDPASE